MEKALDLNNFDKSVSPTDNFNEYVNGIWMKKNEIPAKYSKWGTFEVLHEENLNRLNNIIKTSDCEYARLKRIYDEFMNIDKLETLDSSDIDKYIDGIINCDNKAELWRLLGQYHKYGIVSIFSFYPSEDAKNSSMVVPYLHTGGLGLPDRDYYFDNDKKDVRDKYIEYLESTWELYHMNNKRLDHILDLETIQKKMLNCMIYKKIQKKNIIF